MFIYFNVYVIPNKINLFISCTQIFKKKCMMRLHRSVIIFEYKKEQHDYTVSFRKLGQILKLIFTL